MLVTNTLKAISASDIANLEAIVNVSDVDMSEEDANSPSNATSNSQQYLIDTITQLEHRLQKALTTINSYQIERDGLIARILDLRIRLQNVVDLLEE